MLMPAVVLDTAMTAAAALTRFARYGFWIDPTQPQARAWLEASAARLGLSFDAAAGRLRRESDGFGAALRRQWGMQILWYARPVAEVLARCQAAPPDEPLLRVLNLHEADSPPRIELPSEGDVPDRTGVVFLGDRPVGVSVLPARSEPLGSDGESALRAGAPESFEDYGYRDTYERNYADTDATVRVSRGPGSPISTPDTATPLPAATPPLVRAWPRIDAPDYAPARTPFTVLVGLGETAQARVTGGEVVIPRPADARFVEVGVELIADGLEAPDGWSRTLRIKVADPTAASVSFRFVGLDPTGPEALHLTTLEVRYLVDGTVCGTAARALVIGAADALAPLARLPFGTAWLDRPPVATPIVPAPDPTPADLTIEIAKPDGNSATGMYQCRLFSPHPLPAGQGPFAIDLGQDARTFAQALVKDIRTFADDPLVDNVLIGAGRLIADRLPAAVFDALRAAAAASAPRPPAVLLVSADPYVPWELAGLEPPLDPARPAYLGAQVVLGRWLRDPSDRAVGAMNGVAAARPPAQPPVTLGVRNMAVMAGLYRAASGLRNLPQAEEEAAAIAQSYDAVQLAASTQDVKRLLDAQLTHHFQQIGGVEAVHFAGHGDVDPAVPDGAMLMLSNGRPLPSLLFRSARYGGARQPLFFLNACMIGVGGELLGDTGGFPGHCLHGGFGALLGALWEIDDTIARQFAIAFWERALPPDGTAAVPVGEVLRDLRSHYDPSAGAVPAHTWLAYVYYGHPRLTLQRIP